MNKAQDTVTMHIGGAQLTVETQALFRAWMEKHLPGNAAAPAGLAIPPLQEGEEYVGAILSADGSKRHHIILLPHHHSGKKAKWQVAMDYAASVGAELPDRCESALLFATKRDQFKPEWYWTREQHAGDVVCAWCQYFGYGSQLSSHKDYECRVVLVRRVAI